MKRSLAIFVLLILTGSQAAFAQEPLRFLSVRVALWPEFDRPSVLVIYYISLAPDTPLPATINLRLPGQAQVNAVAYNDPNIGLVDARYFLSVIGDEGKLAIISPGDQVQVEYYIDYVNNGNLRQVNFQWYGDAAVDVFNLVFQKPVGAENLITDPPAGLSFKDEYDLMNYETETISLKAGEIFTFFASYEKNDEGLSVASIPVEPETPLEDTSGQTMWEDVLPWIVGGIGLVLIILGLMLLFGFVGNSDWRHKRRKLNQGAKPTDIGGRGAQDLQVIYCHECGRRTQSGDHFCRSCGTRLKIGRANS